MSQYRNRGHFYHFSLNFPLLFNSHQKSLKISSKRMTRICSEKLSRKGFGIFVSDKKCFVMFVSKMFRELFVSKNWSMWVIENRKYRPVMTLVIIFLIGSKIARFDWLKFQLGWFEELYETRGRGDLHRCSREVRRGPWGGLFQRQKRTLPSNEKTSTRKISRKTN